MTAITRGFVLRVWRPLRILAKWALGCTIWVFVWYRLSGGRNLEGVGSSLTALVAWYMLCALLIAVAIASLHGWLTSRRRAALFGVACANVSTWLFGIVAADQGAGLRALLLAGLFMSPLGAIIAFAYWSAPGGGKHGGAKRPGPSGGAVS